MTNRIFIPAIICSLLLFSAIFAQAMSEPDLGAGFAGDEPELTLSDGPRGEHQGHRLEMMATILDLSEGQQEQIRQLFAAERDSHQGLRQERHTARTALDELMRAQPFDETAFRNLAQQQADRQVDALVARARVKQQVFAILTPEQQEKADQLWVLMGKRHQERGMKH